MEQLASEFILEFVLVSEPLQLKGAYQLTHPFAPLAAENDVTARIVTFPDVALQTTNDMEPSIGNIELQCQEWLGRAAFDPNGMDVPCLEHPPLPSVRGIEQPATVDFPDQFLTSNMLAFETQIGTEEEVCRPEHLLGQLADNF